MKKKYYSLGTFLLLNFLAINNAFAQIGSGGGNQVVTLRNPLCRVGSNCTLIDVIERLIAYVIWLAAPIFVILVIYGGYKIMFARGNTSKVKEGSQVILQAAIGYGVILISWGVVALIRELLGVK